jgi:hypothetical protein
MAKRRAGGTSALIPAAARAPESLTPVEAVLNGEAIELFTKVVGGRDQLAEVLSIAGTSPDVEKIANLLLDPKYARVSLRRICGYTGLTVADLFTAYKKALLARAHIEATHIIASRLTPVVADVMTRAAPQRLVCPQCLGTSAAGQGPCPTCSSTGYVQTEPDLERQKLALEIGQLIEKKGGILMQQNTIAAGALASSGSGSLEQLHQAVGDLLFSSSRRRAAAPPITIEAADDPPVVSPADPPRVPRASRDTDDSDRHAPDPDHDLAHDHPDAVDSSAPPAEIGDGSQDPTPDDA